MSRKLTTQTKKRLTALLLSIAMVFSMVVDALPAAFAAGEGADAPASGHFDDSTSTRRPGLYVDFLGDNNKYVSQGQTASLGNLVVPADEDWSAVTNPKVGGETTWTGYKQDEVTADGSTIFWVGVGIDRMNLLDLFRQNDNGIYSLELGFYYDSQFIEPYTGSGDYKAVIEAANLDNYTHKWGRDYQIVAAETDLKPQVEPVTQERMDGDQFKPDLAELTNPDPDNSWRMTYVSLEKTGMGASRFSGIYDPDRDADKDEETRYLLLIPFRLKGYDPNYHQRLCLRLVRNASLFSIGGGEDGASPYAAWEKVTVRNKDRELKLMTNFQGDLNIFNGGKQVEEPYQADLVIHNYGGVGNEAILSVTNDPSYDPVSASSGGNSTIYGLYGGTGMTLDVTVQSGYTVEVIVCNRGAWNGGQPDPGDVISRTEVWDNDSESHYTFIMPDGDVEVHVIFSLTPTTEFWLYLSEDHDQEDPLDPAEKISPNYTKLTATYDTEDPIVIDRDTDDDNYGKMPGAKVKSTSRIEIDVDLHEDYNAVIRIFNWATGSNMEPDGILPPGTSVDADSVITMTESGQLVVASMPQSDVVVYVTYEKATQYKATLMVDHELGTEIMKTNVAQLETTLYTDANDPVTAYSGVVYHDDSGTADDRSDDKHDAVAKSYYPDHYPLPKVDASAAALSGSLGGDGPRGWDGNADSIMAQVYAAFASATDPAGFAAGLSGNLSAYDLQNVAVPGKAAGLRKDTVGTGFVLDDVAYDPNGGGAIPEIYHALYDMLSRAAGTGADGLAPTEVREDPGDPTSQVVYTYYDLTPAQVQMYLLDHAAAGETGGDVTQVAIRDAASADAALGGYTWKVPSLTSVPPTASEEAFIQVRSGRQVAVLLEADSAYTVLGSIVIKDPKGAHPDVVLQVPQDVDIQNGDYKDRDPDYKNVYLFDMPDYDCEVWVTYGLRKTGELRLSIEGDNGEAGNTASVVAYTPAPPPGATYAQAVTIDKDGDKIENVLVDSTATVTVHVAPGYEVTATIIAYKNGVIRQITTTSATSPIRDPVTQALLPLPDGTVFTFLMPECDEDEYAEVRIKYEQTEKEVNNAHIRARDYPGSVSDSRNRAVWAANGSPDMVATEDDLLEGVITVAPGSYIHSVTTYTKDGEAGPYLGAGYPFFLEGNGWNNGKGGTVKLTTTMPDEEYWVEVTFRNGPPDPEPEQALSLLVRDVDNTGTDNNWAKATVERDPDPDLVLGPVGKTQGSMYSSGYAVAGETVKLDFEAQVNSGYYVESIEVLPGVLAVPVSWTSTTTAEFVMPAGSAAVVVTFRKTNPDVPRPPLFLYLDKTERGGTDIANTINSFRSPTIPGGYTVGNLPQWAPNRATVSSGAARAGETVSLDIEVAAGWHIHSLTVTGDNGRLSYELPYDLTDNGYNGGAGGNVAATFVMPNSDASVVVNYRKGEPPTVKTEFEMELMVVDPDNVLDPEDPGAVYADNWASAVISGQSGTVGPVGRKKASMRQLAYTRSGEVVTIDYQVDTGYALDIIIVTPTGLKIPVTYLEGGKQAQFTMPAEDVTVLVRFKAGEPNRYTANLVLHMPNLPDGTPMPLDDYDLVGEGTFHINIGGIQYQLSDPKQKIYSVTATPGQRLDVDLWAKDGYYIRAVEVAPQALGVGATLSGAFGRQDSSLVMPAANIQVNVYFERGWPDDKKEYDDTVNYDLTLEVYDSTATQDSTANFVSIVDKLLTAPNNDKVKGGESLTITPKQSYDDDLVKVALDPAAGCYAESVMVRDSRGKNVPWRYVPGGIAFEMTPAHVTVTVKYAQLPPGGLPEHTLRLHVAGAAGGDSASVSLGGSTILDHTNTSVSRQVAMGETLTLSAAPDRGIGHTILAAYAVAASGTQLIVPMTLAPNGGTVDFAMPDEDADVWVYFTGDPDQQPDPDGNDLMGTLIVSGPTGAGAGELYARVDGVKEETTGTVNAAGGGSMFATRDTELVVDLTVNPGYYISAIRVIDGQGARVGYIWTQGKGQKEFTLSMPITGVQVYVELKKLGTPDDPEDPVDTTQLTAQVVVNNGGGVNNKATLRQDDGTGAFQSNKTYLKPVSAGEQIYLDITVQPGYQIEYVKMVPVKGGVAPTLYQPTIQTQSTYFVMPGEDVVVYVRFVRDDRDRWNATLVAEGDNTSGNQAWIRSVYSGQKGPVSPVPPPDNSVSVLAAAATATQPAEWVYVDYQWADGCSVKSVTVVDAAGNSVPFTQELNDNVTRRGKIRFPMVDSNVTVTVIYQKDPEPVPKYPVVLHVTDLGPDGTVDPKNWSKTTWGTDQRTVNANGDNEADPLMVPAGETVDVDIHAEPGVHIQAAYVLYRDGGQMLYFNLDPDVPGPGFTGDKKDDFVMHPGRVDVYVYYTRTKPLSNDYAAVLMLDSPSEDTTSTATITNEDADTSYQIDSVTVVANTPANGHGYVTATEGDRIEVQVTPAPGYAIESILMTPLGTSSDQGGPVVTTRRGNQYTFTMPAQNVAVRVKLRKSSTGEYKAWLHYRMAEWDPVKEEYKPTDPKTDWASLSYTGTDGILVTWDQDGTYELVDEGTDVTLGVSLDDPRWVLAAYVLREDGYMEPLSKALEMLQEGKSDPDDTLLDDEAVFTMPAADVHAFVWFTEDPPPVDQWRTAVLTVTDDDGAGLVNSGLNSANIWSKVNNPDQTEVFSVGVLSAQKVDDVTGLRTGPMVPGHHFMWVQENETVTVKINPPHTGYMFQNPATISHSDGSATLTLTEDASNRPEYVYTYDVGPFNSAVRAHFRSSTLVQNPLKVVLIDKDNPGNGTVTNVVRVTPGSMTPLSVQSTTSAGARQRVPDVLEGTSISFTVTPDQVPGSVAGERYMAVARWIDDATNVSTTLPLTQQPDGSYVGTSFAMPSSSATLEVTFYKAWNVTLSVVHTAAVPAGDRDSVAQLTESALGTTITAVEAAPGSVVVPNATNLAAAMQTLNPNVRVVGVLLKRSGRVDTQLLPDGAGIYHHILSRSDVEIQFILAPETEDDRTYIASVSAVNKPDAAVDPEIHVTSDTRGEGPGWTEAKVNDSVEVTLDVPYGYKAVLTATNGAVLSETTVDATDVTTGITGKVIAFTMPPANVHVTVRYVKTRFTATIRTAGNGSGTAVWDNYPTTAVVTDLKGGETLPFTATPAGDSRIGSIIGSGSIGYISGSTNSTVNHTITMPEEDVVITVVFTREKTKTYYLDLHVSGTAGGTAILSAAPGTLQSTPTNPKGFSRIDKVESGERVTLTAKPEPGYFVTVSYYLHSGNALSYITDTITPDPDNGGEITFDMPSSNTCVYVSFHKGENPPVVPPDTPENPDPKHYLDLHVSGTGGGTAVLDAGIVGTLQSTPVAPKSVSTLRPIGTGTPVTLTVTPEPGYTVSVTYYVYHNGIPVPTTLTGIASSGGTAQFTMPSQSTCVYVTFRGPDRLPYLDLHVTNPRGGEAILETDGFGVLTSTPAAPQTYGQLKPVEGGTPVTLRVKPGENYTVTVTYYRHDGQNLYYDSYLIDTGNGGVATFDMPGTNTCIYVKFNGPGDEPSPDPNDPDHYLDLHVSGTQGGTATLTPDGMTELRSSPDNPHSISTVRPVANGTPVTLTVTPEPGYTASISSYVYNTGGTVVFTPATRVTTYEDGTQTHTFDMPDSSTCVYVTFKRSDNPDPSDPNKYLDLHVSGLANGSASLTTTEDTPRSVSSTPAAPRSVSTIQPVAAGTPVTLEVTPELGYAVTVSYYVHNGGTFQYNSYTVDALVGGTATFDMPSESTCIYVHFHKPSDPVDPPDPPDPPEPDPKEYIAFVTTVGTDGLPDNAAQDIVNRTNTSLGGGVLWRYGETGDNMFVTFTTEPGYTATVTATRVDNGASVSVNQQGSTLVGTASLNMPGGTDVKVTITYSKTPQPENHKLSLRLVGHDGVAANMGELVGGANSLRLNGADGPVQTTADAGAALALDAGWALKYRIRRITITSGGVTTDLNWNEYGQTAASLFFMPDADALVTVYFNSAYKATLFVIDTDGNDFRDGAAADTTDPTATNVPNTELEVTRLGASLGATTKTHDPIEDLYGDERVTATVDRGTLPEDAEIAAVIATTNSGTRNLIETAANSGIYPYDMSTATRDPDDVDVTVILRDKEEDLYIATVYKVGHDNKAGNTAAIKNDTTTGLPAGTIWTGGYEKDGLTVSVTTEPDYYAIVTAVIAGTNTPVPVLQWAVQGSFDATLTMPGANVDITVTYTKDPPKSNLKLTLSGHEQKAGNIGTVSDVAGGEPTLPLTTNGGMAPDTNDYSVTRADVPTGTQLQVWGQPDTGFMVEKMELKVAGMTIALTMDALNQAYTPLPYGDVEIIVYYKQGNRTPRPFDPDHPHEVDNGDGTTTVVDDYEHGKIIGENNNNDTATVVVPVLYGKVGKDENVAEEKKYNPYFNAEQVTFKLYFRDDGTGAFTEIPSTDYTMTAPSGSGAYDTMPSLKKYEAEDGVEYEYTSAKFILGEVAGGQLEDKIKEGLTLYITATYDATVTVGQPWQESLHTQLIIPPADQSPRPYDPEHTERYNAPGVWAGGNYPTLGDDSDNPDWSDPNYEGWDGWLLANNQEEKITVLIPTLYYGDMDGTLNDSDALTDAGATTPVADGETPELPPIYNFYWLEETDDGAGGTVQTYWPLLDGVDIDIDVSSMKSLSYADNPKGDFPKTTDPDPQIHHYGYELTFTPHKPADGNPATAGADILADYIENGGIIYVTSTRRGGTDAAAPTWVEQESEKTQVIIRNDAIPKPSDPEDLDSDDYEDRWITSQNWVDYLIVTVPTLDTDGKHPISVDEEHVTFKFYLTQGPTADPDNGVDVTDLLVMINPNIFFSEDEVLDGGGVAYGKPHMVWDTRDISYPGEYIEAAKNWTPSGYAYEAEYESGNYYTGPDKDGNVTDFIGARFVLQISKEADTVDQANADILREIWDNYGTMSDDPLHQYRLYISAVNNSTGKDKESGKTDFEVPPYYTLSGILESYAPAHAATFRLYDTDTGIDRDRLDSHGYDVDDFKADNVPFLVYQQLRDWDFGSGLWQLEYAIRTSELMGNYDLLIEKAGHVSFTWKDMELSEDTLDPADPRKLTFTVAGQEKDASGKELVAVDEDGRLLPGVIALYGGDINNDRYVRLEDYTVLSAFFGGQRAQNRETDKTSSRWKNSTYNPLSPAYLADLDGDLFVSPGDHAIWNAPRNYNKNYTDYAPVWELRTGNVTIVTAAEFAILMEAAEESLPEEILPEEELPEELLPEEPPPEEIPPEEILPGENPPEEVPPEEIPPEGALPEGEIPDGEEPDEGEEPPQGEIPDPDEGEQEPENEIPEENAPPPEAGEGANPDEAEGETETEPPTDESDFVESPVDPVPDEDFSKETEKERDSGSVNGNENYLETEGKKHLI
jgi:hypothetical protein